MRQVGSIYSRDRCKETLTASSTVSEVKHTKRAFPERQWTFEYDNEDSSICQSSDFKMTERKENEQWANSHHSFSEVVDSLAQYEDCNRNLFRLNCLNSILEELRVLKDCKLSRKLESKVEATEDCLLQIEKKILQQKLQ